MPLGDSWQEPYVWECDEVITDTKMNTYPNDLIYLKRKIDCIEEWERQITIGTTTYKAGAVCSVEGNDFYPVLTDIKNSLTDIATETTLSNINNLLSTNFDAKISTLATESTLSSVLSSVQNIESKVATESTLASLKDQLTNTDFEANQVTVGTSASALPSPSLSKVHIVIIKADDDNTDPVYVGKSGVTTSNGFRLNAGQGVSLEVSDPTTVYLISSADNQKAHVIYQGA